VRDVFGGTNSAVGMGTPVSHTSITIDSGKYNNVYGGGSSWQGTSTRAKDYNAHIILNGGMVGSIYGTGSGNTDNAHQKSVTIEMNGGTVTNLYGAHKDGTVYEGIDINLHGGTVTSAVYGGDQYIRPS